jgi:hypothetical protein
MRAATMAIVVLLGASGSAPAAAPVKEPKPEIVSPQNPESEVETLWKSEAARADCLSALTSDAPGPEPAVCAQGTVAKLARGTGIRTQTSSATCGSLKAVKVVSGKNAGKTGCLSAAAIKPEGARKTPQ